MLRLLALTAVPALVQAGSNTIGQTCTATADCVGAKNLTCRAYQADGAKKCLCAKSVIADQSDACASSATTLATLLASDVGCDNTGFPLGNLYHIEADDVLKNTQCNSAHVMCKDGAIMTKASGCVMKEDITLGTEIADADSSSGNGTTTAKMYNNDDYGTDRVKTTENTKHYLDCAAAHFASDSKTCADANTAALGGACYSAPNMTKSTKTLSDAGMECKLAAGVTTGAGKIVCKSGKVDDKSTDHTACVDPVFKGTCDSATAGTPASTSTSTANTYALPTGYVCPKVEVPAVEGTSELQEKDKLACATGYVPWQGDDASTTVTCVTKAVADAKTKVRLGGYCSVDANCKLNADGDGAITTDTGKCRVNKSGASLCSCVKALKTDGSNCLGADTVNDAIATANACYSGAAQFNGVTLQSLQVLGTGMKCDTNTIACDGAFKWDNIKGEVTYGYMLNSDGTGCDKWTGDISKAQACKTDTVYTAFAANAVCKESKIGCPKTPETGNTTICAMNKAMCGKKPSATVKSGCQCPYLMHKTTKSDDPDFDEKSCVATVVGATCSATPAETFPASSPGTAYKCSSNKIACQSSYLECKNAGPMKGRCIPKTAIATKTADQTAANLAKKYTVCPTTKAPSTTAAPSSASTLAVSAVAVLATLALA